MDKLYTDFRKWWLESRGRGRPAPRYNFQESEIVSTAYPRTVSSLWNATYVNLHPTHYAVAVGPDGKVTSLKGGINNLPPGRYNLHYIDKQSRVAHIPRTEEITCDGFRVALELVITYRVTDPGKALAVQNAVETLLGFIQSDIKEFIRSHKYDEIVGDPEGHKIAHDQVALYIKAQHTGRYPISKLFLIEDVVIKEKSGDSRVVELREKQQINQRQFATQTLMQKQNQELEQKLANQDAMIQKIKAQAEVDLQKMTREMQVQKIELDRARAGYQDQQENLRTALETLVRTISNQPYPPDPQVYGWMRDLLTEMKELAYQSIETIPGQPVSSTNGSAKPASTEKINELTKLLSNWQKPAPPS